MDSVMMEYVSRARQLPVGVDPRERQGRGAMFQGMCGRRQCISGLMVAEGLAAEGGLGHWRPLVAIACKVLQRDIAEEFITRDLLRTIFVLLQRACTFYLEAGAGSPKDVRFLSFSEFHDVHRTLLPEWGVVATNARDVFDAAGAERTPGGGILSLPAATMRCLSLSLPHPLPPDAFTPPLRYTVVAPAAIVRDSMALISPQVGRELLEGDIVDVADIIGRRAMITAPARGWISMITTKGQNIVEQVPREQQQQQQHAVHPPPASPLTPPQAGGGGGATAAAAASGGDVYSELEDLQDLDWATVEAGSLLMGRLTPRGPPPPQAHGQEPVRVPVPREQQKPVSMPRRQFTPQGRPTVVAAARTRSPVAATPPRPPRSGSMRTAEASPVATPPPPLPVPRRNVSPPRGARGGDAMISPTRTRHAAADVQVIPARGQSTRTVPPAAGSSLATTPPCVGGAAAASPVPGPSQTSGLRASGPGGRTPVADSIDGLFMSPRAVEVQAPASSGPMAPRMSTRGRAPPGDGILGSPSPAREDYGSPTAPRRAPSMSVYRGASAGPSAGPGGHTPGRNHHREAPGDGIHGDPRRDLPHTEETTDPEIVPIDTLDSHAASDDMDAAGASTDADAGEGAHPIDGGVRGEGEGETTPSDAPLPAHTESSTSADPPPRRVASDGDRKTSARVLKKAASTPMGGARRGGGASDGAVRRNNTMPSARGGAGAGAAAAARQPSRSRASERERSEAPATTTAAAATVGPRRTSKGPGQLTKAMSQPAPLPQAPASGRSAAHLPRSRTAGAGMMVQEYDECEEGGNDGDGDDAPISMMEASSHAAPVEVARGGAADTDTDDSVDKSLAEMPDDLHAPAFPYLHGQAGAKESTLDGQAVGSSLGPGGASVSKTSFRSEASRSQHGVARVPTQDVLISPNIVPSTKDAETQSPRNSDAPSRDPSRLLSLGSLARPAQSISTHPDDARSQPQQHRRRSQQSQSQSQSQQQQQPPPTLNVVMNQWNQGTPAAAPSATSTTTTTTTTTTTASSATANTASLISGEGGNEEDRFAHAMADQLSVQMAHSAYVPTPDARSAATATMSGGGRLPVGVQDEGEWTISNATQSQRSWRAGSSYTATATATATAHDSEPADRQPGRGPQAAHATAGDLGPSFNYTISLSAYDQSQGTLEHTQEPPPPSKVSSGGMLSSQGRAAAGEGTNPGTAAQGGSFSDVAYIYSGPPSTPVKPGYHSHMTPSAREGDPGGCSVGGFSSVVKGSGGGGDHFDDDRSFSDRFSSVVKPPPSGGGGGDDGASASYMDRISSVAKPFAGGPGGGGGTTDGGYTVRSSLQKPGSHAGGYGSHSPSQSHHSHSNSHSQGPGGGSLVSGFSSVGKPAPVPAPGPPGGRAGAGAAPRAASQGAGGGYTPDLVPVQPPSMGQMKRSLADVQQRLQTTIDKILEHTGTPGDAGGVPSPAAGPAATPKAIQLIPPSGTLPQGGGEHRGAWSPPGSPRSLSPAGDRDGDGGGVRENCETCSPRRGREVPMPPYGKTIRSPSGTRSYMQPTHSAAQRWYKQHEHNISTSPHRKRLGNDTEYVDLLNPGDWPYPSTAGTAEKASPGEAAVAVSPKAAAVGRTATPPSGRAGGELKYLFGKEPTKIPPVGSAGFKSTSPRDLTRTLIKSLDVIDDYKAAQGGGPPHTGTRSEPPRRDQPKYMQPLKRDVRPLTSTVPPAASIAAARRLTGAERRPKARPMDKRPPGFGSTQARQGVPELKRCGPDGVLAYEKM